MRHRYWGAGRTPRKQVPALPARGLPDGQAKEGGSFRYVLIRKVMSEKQFRFDRTERASEPRLTLRNLKVTYHTVKIDATLMALADPTRRELLRRLASHPCRASALATGFTI